MPPHLAIMLSMSWFGIPHTGDPFGWGPDPSWGNWQVKTGCGAPAVSASTCVDGQRDIASRFRPLAGIYSSSGRDEEGLARIDLMLSNVRRPCAGDVGARIDAYAVQLDGTIHSSLHTHATSNAEEIPLQALEHFYSEANAAGLTNAVLPADDSTWYFNNGSGVGLDCGSDHASCVAALKADTIDMLTLAVDHPSSLRIAGLPVLYFYFSDQLSPSEWAGIFEAARRTTIGGSTHDFYALGSHQGSAGAPYFAAFDGISPWIDLGVWKSTSGKDVRAHAAAYAAAIHDELYAGAPKGRVVLGGIGPGFDDFTNGWFPPHCATREIPDSSEASPRDPGVLDGLVDYLQTKGTEGVILETWDDWTEGSFFEPSVTEGTAKLEQLQARLGDLYGEPSVSPLPLRDRWTGYGQPHGCAGAHVAARTALCGGGGRDAGSGKDSAAPDARGGCSPPTVLEPTAGENVGPSIRLRVSAPSCIDAMIPYIDSVEATPAVSGSSIDVWLPVTMGKHTLNVNGWDAYGQVYPDPARITFVRTY
jgi:hypothetical protein